MGLTGDSSPLGWEMISEPRSSGGDQTPRPTVTTSSSEEVTTSRWLTISIKRSSREYSGRNQRRKFISRIPLRPTWRRGYPGWSLCQVSGILMTSWSDPGLGGRGKMLNAVTSMGHLPHTQLDNQQTHYDSVRLLKGAAPGRKQVNFYTGELNCIRNSKTFARRCETEHRADVLAGHFDWSVHHTGMGGVSVDQKFYDPQRVKDYTGSIRFKDPERSVPVLA